MAVRNSNNERIIIGTWNVRTLLQARVENGAERSLINLFCIMKCNNINILGVSETNWRGQGYFQYSIIWEGEPYLYHIFYSGTTTPPGQGSSYGVAIILSDQVYDWARTISRLNPAGMEPSYMYNKMAVDLHHLGIQVIQIYAQCMHRKTEAE